MIDGYVELSSGDKVLFMKAVNSLLFHTFITLYVYDAEEGRRKSTFSQTDAFPFLRSTCQ